MATKDFDHLLHLAAASPHGLVLQTNDPQRLRQVLYSARTRLGDSSMGQLELRIVPEGFGPDPVLVIRKVAEGRRPSRRPAGGAQSAEDLIASFLDQA